MTSSERTRLVKQTAVEMGFDRVGIAPVDAPLHGEFLRAWLDRGYAGQMAYLHKRCELRTDPRRFFPGARSVICVAMNYYQDDPDVELPDDALWPRGRWARYVWGQDYHILIRRRLGAMRERLEQRLGERFGSRCFVDTAPVMERSLAAAAGLGWIGKNAMLIVPRLGSFVFLGGVMTTLKLDPDPPVGDRCGRCRRCMDACPTGAIVEPHVVDARRCVSYLTIEHRGSIPLELRPFVGNWVFGCDLCQRVCPHNLRIRPSKDPALAVRFPAPTIALEELLHWSDEQYASATRGRAIRRAGLAILRRNAVIAMGNIGGQKDLDVLKCVIQDRDPLVGEHARWARDQVLSR